MKLCTVRTQDLEPFFGILIRDKILRLAAAADRLKLRPSQRGHFTDLLAYLAGLPHSEKVLRAILQRIAEAPKEIVGKAEDGAPFLLATKDVTFLPPVRRPGKFLCIGLNYKDHCEEQNKPLPEIPIVFNKFATSLRGHEEEIALLPKVDASIDYEAELAFVIGKEARRVKKKNAMAHVAGYMIVNDLSARTLQHSEKQWARAKGFDGSGPCGPYLVTADEVPDPQSLPIRLRLNGKVMQSSNTKHLVFGVADLIEHISAAVTLEPGDVISTGTPGGVGMYREPQVFLKAGDKVEVEIEGLGLLRNTFAKS